MENHLFTLNATLRAIAQLHANSEARLPRSRPFTAAILNTHKLDVLDFIRDADPLEANLFWYPPSSMMRREGEIGGGGHATDAPPDIHRAPRLPEPKAFVPPTPLRKQAREAEAQGQIDFDARTLLKAAHRLLDNYHNNAPRARKHVKTLLRKHTELQRMIRQLESEIAASDESIAQLQVEGKKLTVATSAGPSKKAQSNPKGNELRALQDEIRREEMELMAIEQTIEELQDKRKRLTSPKRIDTTRAISRKSSSTTTSASTSAVRPRFDAGPSPASSPRLARSSAGASSTPQRRQRVDSTLSSPATGKNVVTNASTRTSSASGTNGSPAKARTSNIGGAADATVRLDSVDVPDAADETVRLRPSEQVEEGSAKADEQHAETTGTSSSAAEPASSKYASSDELDRVCESIWNVFGDHLRYVVPGRDAADYQETLDVLDRLSKSQGGMHGADTSLASSNASQSTAATSGSSVDTAASASGPPTPAVAVSAFILRTLLTTPSPHSTDLASLKRIADAWWESEGIETYRAAMRQESGGGDAGAAADVTLAGTVTTGANTLAAKAVFELVAKKLLKLRFEGAQRIVSFPPPQV